VAEFLSDDWLDDLEHGLVEAGPFASQERLALGQLVRGAPQGDVSYTLVLGGAQPCEVVRGTDRASVVLLEDYPTAVAIAAGQPSSELLAEGRVKIRGDIGALLRAEDLLAAIAPTLASVAAATTYP
jgi:hypothetical protein